MGEKRMSKDQDKQPATVKSADRVLDIFELFAEVQESMSLTEISRSLNMPASSTYKLLKNMHARGYLETDRHEKMFYLGHKIFEIGTRYVQKTNLAVEFQQVAERIVDEVNESVFLSIRNGDKVLYIGEKQSSHPIRFVSHLGMKLPLHATAMGKVLLSSMNSEEAEQLYSNEELGSLTERTVQHYSELKGQLEQIRNEGLAYSYGEAVQGVRCVAAPIRGSEEQVIAAMSVSIPESRLTEDLWERTKACVSHGARELSLKMFYKKE
jgi:IclR family KDG regulon transcriptional repressor